MPSQERPVSITSFWGRNDDRNVGQNREYGVGTLCVNMGRRKRAPLQARSGLRPITASTENAELSGVGYAIGALPQGNRLQLVVRIDKSLVRVEDAKPKDYT